VTSIDAQERDMASKFLAVAFLVFAASPSVAAEKTLNMKLISFYVGEKDGVFHNVGATILPNGTTGTKDYYVTPKADGTFEGKSTYYFDNGSSIQATFTGRNVEKNHSAGTYVIAGGTGDYKDAKGQARSTGCWERRALCTALLFSRSS
jgi:hypothetical protein